MTYVVSGNFLETDGEDDEGAYHDSQFPILATEDTILWQDQSAYFKNRADAVAFVQLLGAGEECYGNFPE